MPWNPSDQNKDPWGRNKNKPQAPPDLDALLRQYKDKLWKKLSGGKHRGDQPSSGFGAAGFFFTTLIILAIVVIWALSGLFIVSPSDRAVIQRFGRYTETVGSGLHWIPQLIETEQRVNVQRVYNVNYESDMLTKDENIVSVSVNVWYRVADAKDYLFNVVAPNISLEQATASALRQVVGHNKLDDLLTTGRSQVREQVATLLQQILANYKTGLVVTEVTLQPIKPPEEVTAAFDDAIKAREDQEAYANTAEAYAKKVKAEAQGKIARILQEAQAYQQSVVQEAKAATAGYMALLPEYRKNPQVMTDRLYIAAMENILSKTSKVLVDQKGGNPLYYLPLDKLSALTGNQESATGISSPSTSTNVNPTAISNAIGAAVSRGTGYPTRGDNS